MRRIGPAAFAALALSTFMPSPAQAQATLGPAIAYHDDFNLGLGAGLNVPVQEFGRGVSIMADFFYFFPDNDLNYLELNGNLTYSFPLEGWSATPYILGGVNVANISQDLTDESSTELGVNLGGGIYFDMGRFRPTIGAKIEVSGGEGFVVFGHLPFVIGAG